jgi:hypothetical protein
VNDVHWTKEVDTARASLEFYFSDDGHTGMIGVADPTGRWWFFDAQDSIAYGSDHDATFARADDRYASRPADDIPF